MISLSPWLRTLLLALFTQTLIEGHKQFAVGKETPFSLSLKNIVDGNRIYANQTFFPLPFDVQSHFIQALLQKMSCTVKNAAITTKSYYYEKSRYSSMCVP